ncbi:alpha/beta fold hydrolase [bacterium]|nr:alpha/beta fold hydrolase [bacterium]
MGAEGSGGLVRAVSLVLMLLLALGGCHPRGSFSFDAEQVPGTAVQAIFVATDRKPSDAPLGYSGLRATGLSYAKIAVSIPPSHRPGRIEWPSVRGGARPDPARNFVVRSAESLGSASAFQTAVRVEGLPGHSGDIVVFVHGYNNTFAESVYRLAQFSHDYDLTGPQVLFAWSSSASPLGYLYDRDSVTYARDSLEKVLTDLARHQTGKIFLVGHSMGSQLVLETLRQMTLDGNHALDGRLSGVTLVSPDIDVQVFRRLLERIKPLPQPFVVFISHKDQALRLSADLTGQPDRLGSVSDLAQLAQLPITVIDLSAFSQLGDLNHMVAATSPGAIALIKGMEQSPPPTVDRPTGLLDIVLAPRAP